MSSEIAKYNLDRDKNVQGKDWLSTYGNWFSDEENIQLFINTVKPILPDGELDILYAASASGLLGEELIKSLGRGRLTLVDISEKHLSENHNPNTVKICADLLEMDLGKKFDVILVRSSLDYFPSRSLQVKVLKIIRNHLKESSVFINQPAYISDIEQRNIIRNIYNTNDKIGNRFFQSSDLASIYDEAGLSDPEKIGHGKEMNLTEQDHVERYGLVIEDIKSIQTMLKDSKSNIQITKDGYNLKFEFPIFLARLKK